MTHCRHHRPHTQSGWTALVALLLLTTCAPLHAQGVRGFGTSDARKPPPGFGEFGHLIPLVNDRDRENGLREVRQLDKNGNLVIDPEELQASDWNEYYYGKKSRGTWKLVVRNLGNVQAGFLQKWTLILKRE